MLFFWGGGGGGRARLESTDKLAIPQDDCDSGELICTKNQVLDDLHISSVFLISSLLFSVISCTMPSLEVGTVGGGTVLGPQSACLKVTFFFNGIMLKLFVLTTKKSVPVKVLTGKDYQNLVLKV